LFIEPNKKRKGKVGKGIVWEVLRVLPSKKFVLLALNLISSNFNRIFAHFQTKSQKGTFTGGRGWLAHPVCMFEETFL
jgi:hypothetical protein